MAFEDVSCLIVTAPGGSVSGVITATDLLAWLARADGYLARGRKDTPP
jgi:predicted transcriptional regulator